MDIDFAQVGTQLDGNVLCLLRRMDLISSPSNLFAPFRRWIKVLLFDISGMSSILLGRFRVITLVLTRACQFLLNKLAMVLIDMIFGV
jgi:hypothetical protein